MGICTSKTKKLEIIYIQSTDIEGVNYEYIKYYIGKRLIIKRPYASDLRMEQIFNCIEGAKKNEETICLGIYGEYIYLVKSKNSQIFSHDVMPLSKNWVLKI